MTAATAQSAGKASKFIEWLARIGYAAKGVVYGTVGMLAGLAVFGGSSGETAGPTGAVRALGSEAYGWIPLAIIALGLFCYVFWCFIQAVLNPEQIGRDFSGLFQRVVRLIAGLIYGGLAFYTIRLAFISGGGDHSKDAMTARLMSYQGGIWLIIVLGAIVAGVGIAQFVLAWRERYKDRWRTREMTAAQEHWAGAVAKWGLGARGVVFLISGGFVIASGWQADPDKATGLGGALSKLAQQSYGAWLLAVVAFGLVCYGAYCMIDALYARINP